MNRIQQQSATIITAVPCRDTILNKNHVKYAVAIDPNLHDITTSILGSGIA
jgi:hypothetical protein